MSETRKIAAILVADVVGYSRLAGADEDRTLARLRGLRSDLIDPAIDAHHGRIVKRTGDGILIEFRSVVDAVRCAIEVQQGLIERNAGVPAERRIEFRVGIHLGDVVEEADGDLMGDGVNIAARLEGFCPASSSTTCPKPPRLPGGSLNSIARTRERLSNVASTSNESLANMCKSTVGSFARKRPVGTGNAMVSRGASLRLLSVAIGPFWPNSAQKFRMRRRRTDASRLFFKAKPGPQLLGSSPIDLFVEHADDHVTIRAIKFLRASFLFAKLLTGLP